MKATFVNRLTTSLRLITWLFVALWIGPLCYAKTLTVPTITVNEKKSDTAAINKRNNQVTVNQKQLKQSGAISITDYILQQGLVRLKNSSAVNNQTSIDIHGFGGNAARNSLILIDGIPFTSFNVVGPNLNALLLDNIANLIIIPGSHGSIYGNQAVGGVVKLITHKPSKKLLRVNASAGNKQQASISGFSSQRFSNSVGYNLGALAYHTNNFQQHNLQNNYNLNAKLDYQGSQHYVAANFLGYHNDIEMPQTFIYHQPRPRNAVNNNYTITRGNFSYLIDKWFINDFWESTTTLSSSNSDSHGTVNIPFTNSQENLRFENRNKTVLMGKQVVAGATVQQDRYRLDNSKQHKHVKDAIGELYGQTVLPINSRWAITLGGRTAHQAVKAWPNQSNPLRDHTQVTVTEQTLSFKPNQHLRYYLRRDGNYRFAKADEKIWIKNNINNLHTQRGTSYEAGMAWQQHQQQLKVGVYHLTINNEIAYDPNFTPEAPFGYMKNLPPTQRNGIDFYYARPLTSTIDANTQLSYVDPTFRSGVYRGKQIPAVSPVKASVALNIHPHPSWLVSLEEVYNSRYFASDDLANAGGQLPSYYLTNLFIKKSWRKTALSLRLNNVFDKHYPRYTDYVMNNNGQGGDIYYYPADGFTVLVTLHINCDNV